MKLSPVKEEERFKLVKDYLASLTVPVNANIASRALGIKTCTLILLLLRCRERLRVEAGVNVDKVGGQWVIWR